MDKNAMWIHNHNGINNAKNDVKIDIPYIVPFDFDKQECWDKYLKHQTLDRPVICGFVENLAYN